MKRLAIILGRALLLTLPLFLSLGAQPAHAIEWGSCVVNSVPTIQCLEVVFERLLSIVLSLIGLSAFIMIIVASFQLLLSGGDPKQTEKASKTLTYAVGGLIGVFLVWFILQFVSEFTGVQSILRFRITTN
jgi:hypothetical protein